MKRYRLQKNDGSLSAFGKTVGVLVIFLVGLASYLAVNPAAHEFFHPDAGHGDHECVVTAFAAGEGLFVAPEINLRPTTEVVRQIPWIAAESLHNHPTRTLPPACGPPWLNAMV